MGWRLSHGSDLGGYDHVRAACGVGTVGWLGWYGTFLDLYHIKQINCFLVLRWMDLVLATFAEQVLWDFLGLRKKIIFGNAKSL